MFMNTDGSIDSTIEINDSTVNGPMLSNDDFFGTSVANIGDLNNDGVTDLAVGAPGDDNFGLRRGALHILFMNTDGSIYRTLKINNSTANGPVLTKDDDFGYSVANIGDLNNDGVDDLAVGAPGDDGGIGASDRGALHIMFMYANGSIASTVKINDSTTNGPDLSFGDEFGYSVANIGDLDRDGVDDLAVGAWGAGIARGALHIMFMNTDGSIDSTIEINDFTFNGPVLSDGDLFGSSVAKIGDLNNDGLVDLAVGAPRDDNPGTNQGALHIIFLKKTEIFIVDPNTVGSVFITIQDALDAIPLGEERLIFIKAGVYSENILLNRDISAILEGGFNANFSAITGEVSISEMRILLGDILIDEGFFRIE